VSNKKNNPDIIRDDLVSLDKLLEHRVRLGICVLLTQNDSLTFQRFKELLQETDGSLGAHLRRLEDAEYISVKKEFRDRKPVSWYTLTEGGRTAIDKHLTALQHLIQKRQSTSQ
jgi:DNA-binding MarR family transcriptional regulator